MAELAQLKPDADSSPLSPGDAKTSSKIANKRIIIIAAIVVLVLLILVIVLGALLGAERAKRKGKSNCSKSELSLA